MKVTTFRMPDSEYDQMARRCAADDMSVSDYIRGLVAIEIHNYLIDQAAQLAATAEATGFASEWDADCDALEADARED